MREKLMTLSVQVLKNLAKEHKIKGYNALKKDQLVEVLLPIFESMQEKSNGDSKEEPVKEAPKRDTKSKAEKDEASKLKRTVKKTTARSTKKTVAKTVTGAEKSQDKEEKIQDKEEKEPGKESTVKSTIVDARGVKKEQFAEPRIVDRRVRKDNVQENVSEEAETQTQEAKPSTSGEVPSRLSNVLIDPEPANGILEIMGDGFGFIRCENFLPGENDVYVAPSQIRRFGLKTGDYLKGKKKLKQGNDKFAALLELEEANGYPVDVLYTRPNFENLTPIFPNERIHLEAGNHTVAMRIVDLMCPIGKGQRGMIVSQPKAGKTTLLKQIAQAVQHSNPEMHLIILLIDERPEEVTDIKESIVGENVEVIYSTFDELPEHHKRVSEMVIERARRLVEHGKDVIILLDSITRLTRAYNVTVQASGRTLSGGLDPAALHMPKRFFGAARNMREGGSLTILATALIETGSKMDDVVFEEFKGTGNMELVLNRKLSEKRVFPAIDIVKSSTRRDDLLLTPEEQEAMDIVRRNLNGAKVEESTDRILDLFARTKNNADFIQYVKKTRLN